MSFQLSSLITKPSDPCPHPRLPLFLPPHFHCPSLSSAAQTRPISQPYLLFAELFQLFLSYTVLSCSAPGTQFWGLGFFPPPPPLSLFFCGSWTVEATAKSSAFGTSSPAITSLPVHGMLELPGRNRLFCWCIQCTVTAATNRTFNKNETFFSPTALTARSQKEIMNR